MNTKQIILTAVISLFVGLGVVTPTSAQEIKTGEMTFCEGQVLPIKLQDVVGLGLSSGGGYWNEVSATDNNIIIAERVSNIFLGADRLPGTYVFMFIPQGNPCMSDDDRAIATIEIKAVPRSISHYVELCPSETINFNLGTLLDKELTDKYTVSYADATGTAVSGGLVTLNAEGEYRYTYQLEGEQGGPCVSSATIALSVVSSEVAAAIEFNKGLAFCQSAIPTYLNLNEKLGFTGKNGVWSSVTAGAPVATNGIITLAGVANGAYEYTYTYTDCAGSTKTKPFTVTLTDDLSSYFKDATRSVCKSISKGGFIDMQGVIGVSLPRSAGVWNEVLSKTSVDVADGIFELEDARRGQYVYSYTVSGAVDLCGLRGASVNVTLNVFDNDDVLSGEVQLCKSNLTSTTTIDLAKFMPNLQAGGTWYDVNNSALAGSTANVGGLPLGIHRYVYEFNGGPCGMGQTELLVVVTDMLTNFKDKETVYCLSDDGSNQINLDQILAVGNIAGTWANTSNASNYNATTHVFDGKAEGVGTYVFTFTASETGCGVTAGDPVVITIKVTDSLVQ